MSANTTWRYYELLFGGEYGIDKGENTLGFATVDNESDARLISAAPELLAALKDVVGWVPGSSAFFTDGSSAAVERARAAIAKAEGRE